MVEQLEVGAEILTVGGLFGHVRSIDGNEVQVEIAPGTTVRLAMRAIATVVSPEVENGKTAQDDEEDPGPSAADEPDSTRANGG